MMTLENIGLQLHFLKTCSHLKSFVRDGNYAEKKNITNMTGAVLDRKCALTLRITIFLHFLFILRNTETNVKSF